MVAACHASLVEIAALILESNSSADDAEQYAERKERTENGSNDAVGFGHGASVELAHIVLHN